MKKLISLLILILIIGCSKKSIKDEPIKEKVNHTFKTYSIPFDNHKGMNYRVYSNKSGGIHVVNETLDSLEVELIKKQIIEIEKLK